MKKYLLFIFTILVLVSCSKDNMSENIETLDVDLNVQQRSPTIPEPEIIGVANGGCVANIIMLAEGFKASEMTEFKVLSAMAKQAILDMEPFTTFTDRLNFYRVASPSLSSGISTIKFENNCDPDPGADSLVSTAWGVLGNRVGLQFYAGMKSGARDLLEDLYGGYATGEYVYTIIIVNTDEYYGGAEFPGVTEHNTISNPRVSNMIVSKFDSGDGFKFLVRHEFGHSFGNLDDEYVDGEVDCCLLYTSPSPRD